jgi:catechol 2,3-dioxygenase-like lactoylglutathione lyase family enzyme
MTLTTANDPLAARGDARSAAVSGLVAVTHVTADRAACARFYRDLMGMTEAPGRVSRPAQRAELAALLGLPQELPWAEDVYERRGVPGAPFVRVIAPAAPAAEIRPGMAALRDGSLSVGFALRDMQTGVARGRELGIETTHGIVSLPFRRLDGSTYLAHETHFRAPDGVYGLGVGRPEDLVPVAPIATDANAGGPAYSAQVANHGEAVWGFYRDVLGFEIRRDVELPYGEAMDGALVGVRPGTVMRFLQLFAPGSETGYLVFLDFRDNGLPALAPPRPPQRGIAAWTFRVRDLDATLGRARAAGAPLIRDARSIDHPLQGPVRAASLLAPNGFLVELIEAVHP